MASTQRYPGNNIPALIIGTGEFSFSPNAVSKTDSYLKGFLPFGNVVAYTPSLENTQVEHFGSYQGVKRKDKTQITQTKLEYTLRCDEWNYQNLKIVFGAADGTPPTTQAVGTDQSADQLTFSAGSPSDPARWYDLTVAGKHVYFLTEVTFTGGPSLAEGTDYEVDLISGRIRFKTQQTAAVTPKLDYPAIVAAEQKSYLQLIPFTEVVKSGYGKLIIYDQDNANKIVLRHHDFSCQVRCESATEVEGTQFSEFTVVITITDEVGVVQTRDDNQMWGGT